MCADEFKLSNCVLMIFEVSIFFAYIKLPTMERRGLTKVISILHQST